MSVEDNKDPADHDSAKGKKRWIPLVLGALGLLALVGTGIGVVSYMGGQAREKDRLMRENILQVARDYAAQEEYDRALDNLQVILVKDPLDPEASLLRDDIIAMKRAKALADEERQRQAQAQSQAANASAQNTSVTQPRVDNSAALATLEAQRAEAEARAREAAAREREAEARRQEAELALAKQIAQQQQEAAARQAAAAQEAARQEEARLAKLSQEEADRQRQLAEYLNRAENALQTRQFVEARSQLDNAKAISAQDPAVLAKEAKALVLQDVTSATNRNQAQELATRATQLNPNLWEPYYVQGLIAQQNRQYDRAIRELNKAAELDNNNADVYYALANAQYDAGQFTAARGSYEIVITLAPGNERAWFNLGLTFERLENVRSAINAYQKAIAVKKDYASAYNRVGELQRTSGDLDAAATNLRQAVTLEPDQDRNHRSLGRVLLDQGRLTDALASFKNAVTLNPNNAQNQYNMAVVLYDQGRVEEAATYAGQAVKLDNRVPEHHYMFGLCADTMGAKAQAKTLYANAIRLNTNYLRARVSLSAIQIADGEVDEALTNLQAALKIDLTSPEVNNNLSTVYRLKKLPANAIDHSLRAVQRLPNSAAIRYNAALAYISGEKWPEAESMLKTTLNLDAKYWDAYARLADVYVAMEKKAEAKKNIETLLAQNPSYPDRSRLEQLLVNL